MAPAQFRQVAQKQIATINKQYLDVICVYPCLLAANSLNVVIYRRAAGQPVTNADHYDGYNEHDDSQP